MCKEGWWNDADRGKREELGETLFLCSSVHQKSHVDLWWRNSLSSLISDLTKITQTLERSDCAFHFCSKDVLFRQIYCRLRPKKSMYAFVTALRF